MLLAVRDDLADTTDNATPTSGFQLDPLYVDFSAAVLGEQPLEDRVLAVMTEIGLAARNQLEELEPLDLVEEVFGIHGPAASIRTQLQRWRRLRNAPLLLLVDGMQGCDPVVAGLILQQLSPFDASDPEQGLWLLVAGHGSLDWMFPDGPPAMVHRAGHITLSAFSATQVQQMAELFRLETGRSVNHEAVDLIMQLTQGHPWLVNLMLEQMTTSSEDREIRGEHVAEAKEQLIGSESSPLQRWFHYFQRPGIQRVVEPLLIAADAPYFLEPSHLEEARALGLVQGFAPVRFANRLLEEWIPRRMVLGNDQYLSRQAEVVVEEGGLNFVVLLSECQRYFSGEGRRILTSMPYQQAGPLLMLQGFISRLVRNHGRIEREVDALRHMITLFIFWQSGDDIQTVILGLKVLDQRREATLHGDLAQIGRFMNLCETKEGHLVVLPPIDLGGDNGLPGDHSKEQVEDNTVHLWRF
ncbi:hypothetical protein [Acanthopleuribacter pedis]|uniref:Uncharacterized protein n=1 Tax=Acanthopleuribacter pedis TaxID=442870 RepID=A0A8J7U384_9BACT|nr:hypothetical protein [Acanthopleuribacter pedis]MBO1317001.1 hypothetical protein [Acanthopleuribacter pedis]